MDPCACSLAYRSLTALVVSLSVVTSIHAETPSMVRTGSGFAVSRATHIVTNAHVVSECTSVRVLSGTQQAAARVIALDLNSDLAVLQTSLSVSKTIAMRSSPALRLGESVIAFGFPLSGSLSQGGNLTTGNVSALAGLGDDPKYLQVTAPVQPGNSGGPLLDGGGNLIGIITAKLDAISFARRTGDIPQNVNFAVKAEVLEAFLQSKKIPYDVAITDRQLVVADVADVAKQAAVKIVCVPSGGPVAEPGTVRVSPRLDALPLPLPPPPAEVRVGPPPVRSDAAEEQMSQIQLLDVRTPYPGSAPAMRELVVSNRSAYSVLQITVGWLDDSSPRHCPVSHSAYRGTKELFVSLNAGESTTTTGEFSDHAKYFCVLNVQFLPTVLQRERSKAELPPMPPAAPSMRPEEPAPTETPQVAAPPDPAH